MKKKKERKPKKEKPYASGTMTKAAFFSFIRSGLRQKSRRWKPIYDCLEQSKRPSESENKRLKWEYQCAQCGDWYPLKNMSVDHITPAGALRDWDDLVQFCRNLFCERDGLQALCDDCHLAKSKEERNERTAK